MTHKTMENALIDKKTGKVLIDVEGDYEEVVESNEKK
jgi:hypothetical protein